MLYVVVLEAGYINCKHPVLDSFCYLVHALQCTAVHSEQK